MKLRSLKFKLTVFYAVFFTMIFMVYGAILYISLSNTLYQDLDSELSLKSEKLEKQLTRYTDLHSTKLFVSTDYISVIDSKGTPVITSANVKGRVLKAFIKNAAKARSEKSAYKVIESGGRRLRVVNKPFTKDGRKYMLQVGSSTRPVMDILEKRFFYIAVSIPFVLIAGSIIGYLFIRKALRPVVDITNTAQGITHEDFGSRIELKHIDEEFRRLIDSFNGMIARLEKSFQHISDFSSHVAHELKTPIAIIRGEAEIALRKERNADEYKRVITTCLEESQRILKTIEDLLLLAKLDYRPEVFKFEETDLSEFIKEIYAQSKIMASEKNISLNASFSPKAAVVVADRVHLRRMFFNVIHNAIKFTPAGGKVDMELSYPDSRAQVVIRDTGIGIEESDLPKIFDKFFHIDRSGAEPGNGLGLSIARSIAGIHRGTIDVSSILGKGSAFTIILPIRTI